MEVHLFEHLQELGISLLTPNSKSSLYLFIGIQSDINYCLHFFSSVLFCFLYHLFNFYCLVCKQKGKPEFYQKVKISFFSLLPSHLTFAVLTFSFSLTLSLGSYFILLSFSSVFFLGVIPTYSSVLSSASWISSLTISQAPQTQWPQTRIIVFHSAVLPPAFPILVSDPTIYPIAAARNLTVRLDSSPSFLLFICLQILSILPLKYMPNRSWLTHCHHPSTRKAVQIRNMRTAWATPRTHLTSRRCQCRGAFQRPGFPQPPGMYTVGLENLALEKRKKKKKRKRSRKREENKPLSWCYQISKEPWLVWLSGLSTGLRTKGSLVDSQSGHMPGLQARSPVGDAQEATTH